MSFLAALMSAVAAGGILSIIARRGARSLPRRSAQSGHLGVELSRAQFWLTAAGAGFATFLVLLATTRIVIVAVVPSVVVATFPRSYYARRRARQLAELLEAWPDGLRDLVSSVRTGASLSTAIENLGRFGPEPLRVAFGGFGIYARSLGVAPALEMIRSDLADPTSDRVIEVLILAHQRGGAVIPAILNDLANATTRDVWTLEQVRSEGLEQKINSRIVFVLPWVVLVAMTAQSSAFRDFYSSSAGALVVTVGGVMSLAGMVIASRIGAQPAEPRVFTGVAQ